MAKEAEHRTRNENVDAASGETRAAAARLTRLWLGISTLLHCLEATLNSNNHKGLLPIRWP